MRKETKNEEICLKKNRILNEIIFKCEESDKNILRGIVLNDKLRENSNGRSLVIMSDSEFHYLNRYLTRLKNENKIIDNNIQNQSQITASKIHWSMVK